MFRLPHQSSCLSLAAALALGAGPTEFPALVDLDALTPQDGVTVRGQYHYGYLGASVGGGGDYNADGTADFLVGAPGPNGAIGIFYPPNYAYVFYGRPNLAVDELALPGGLDGPDGFEMAGEHLFSQFGNEVGDAGDVNGDGTDDFIIGSPVYGGYDGRAYVVFGRAGLGSGGAFDVTTLDSTNGFVIEALAPLDWAGFSVADVGDLNGDGYDDVAVGAIYSDPPGRPGAGRTYVVFGGPNVGAGGVFDPNLLDGSTGS